MKKTKLYAKKSLSLFMAVMMLMSAWVWVAPEHEHAHAATAGKYNVVITVDFENPCDGGHVKADLVDLNGTGTKKTDQVVIETFPDEFKQKGNGRTLTFSTDKWPSKIFIRFVTDGYSTSKATIKSIKIGTKTVVSGGWGLNRTTYTWNSKDDDYQFYPSNDAGTSGNQSGTWDWPKPTPTTLTSEKIKSEHTFYMPASGPATSLELTSVYKDQYGVEWGAGSVSGSVSDTNVKGSGIGISNKSNDTLTITPSVEVLGQLTNYDYKTGKGSTTLTVKWSDTAKQTCTLYFVSSDYTVNYYRYTDAPVYESGKTFKYGTPLSVAEDYLPVNSVTQIEGDTQGLHQTYKWVCYNDTDNIVSDLANTKITNSDFYFQEEPDKQVEHTYDGGFKSIDAEWHGQTCTACKYVNRQKHDLTTVTYDDVNCETVGKKVTTCSGCDYRLEESITHDYTTTRETIKKATCTTPGQEKITYTCNNCPHSYSEVVDTALASHTFDDNSREIRKEADCTADGYVVKVCTVCDADKKTEYDANDPAMKYVDTLYSEGHKYAEVKTPATCTDPGYVTYTCSVCSHTYKEEDKTAPALGHAYVMTETEPTCTDDGVKTYTCSRCGYSYTEPGKEATGHTAGPVVKENIVHASCNTPGSHDDVTYCTVCGEEMSRTKVTDPATKVHNYVATPNKDGTHTYKCGCGESNGETEKCSGGTATCQKRAVCSECYAEYDSLAPCRYEDEVAEEEYFKLPASCTQAAQYYKSCIWCHKSSKGTDAEATFGYGQLLPHTYNEKDDAAYIATEATCQEKATYYTSCSACGKSSKGTEDEALFSAGGLAECVYTREDRKKTYLAAEATCQSPATYYYSCKWCGTSCQGIVGKENTFPYGDKVDHIFDNRTRTTEAFCYKPATCTSYAKYYFTCRWCEEKDTLKTFYAGDKAEHTYTFVQKDMYAETPATCENGGVYFYSCSACGVKGTEKRAGEPLGHVKMVSRTNVVVADCSTPGAYYEITKCNRADCTWTDITVEKTENNIKFTYVADGEAKELNAAVAENGTITFTDGEGNTVEAENQNIVKFTHKTNNHIFGAWIETVAPSCVPGTKIRTCVKCKKTEEKDIPANGQHNGIVKETDTDEDKIYKTDATCYKEGEQYKYCTACKTKVDHKVIPVRTHEWQLPEKITGENGEDVIDLHYNRVKTPATCKDKAVYYKHCKYCGAPIGGDDPTFTWGGVDENGHVFGGDPVTDANGNKVYACQNGCGGYSETECSFDLEGEPDNVVPSTCKALGYNEYWCRSCGENHIKTVELTKTDPENHAETYISIPDVEPTCSAKGYTAEVRCVACQVVVKESTEIPADKTRYPHENMINYEGQEATCQAAGWEAYKYCANCGTYEIEKVEIPKKDHTFTHYVSVGDGTHTATCDVCGIATETLPCEGDGTANCVDKAKCTVCGGECGEVNSENHKSVETVEEVLPTCTRAGYKSYRVCKACGENGADKLLDTIEPIEKLPHSFEGATWTQIDMEVPGETEGETVTVKGHKKVCVSCNASTGDATAVIIEACESDGTANCKQAAKCKICGGTYGEIDPAVHASVETKLVGKRDSTCTVKGYTGDTVYVCCEAVKVPGTAKPLADHEYTVEKARVASTCITKGSVTKACACGAENVQQLPLDSKNHANDLVKTINKVEPTCTTAGYTGDLYHACCYVEGNTETQNRKALIAYGKVVATNGSHVYTDPVPEYKVEYTTNQEGEITDFTVKSDEAVAALTYADKVAARHTDGYWYHVKKCTECNEIVVSRCGCSTPVYNCVETSTCDVCSGLCSLIDEGNHKEELSYVKGIAASCVADGKKGYYNCKYCNKTYLDKAGTDILNLPADADKLIIDKSTVQHKIDWNNPYKTVTGTCGSSGYKLFKCKVEGCDYEAKLDTGIVSSSHTWNATPDGEYVYSPISEPTCGKNGYKAIRCSVCNTIKLNSYVIVPATGEHTYGEPVVIPGEDCKTPGKIIKTCTQCGYKDEQTDTTGVSAHRWSEDGSDGWYVTGGDCSTGVAYERICVVCGTTETKLESSGNHDYQIYERLEPTPESDGYVIYECKNCKFRTDKEILKYEGNTPDTPDIHKHKINYDDYKFISAATCTSAEIREYTCVECFEKVRLPYGEIEPHVWIEQNAEVATCEKDGHNEYYRCVRCLTEYGKVVYPATGHHDGDGNGKCDRCNAAFYEGEGGQGTCSCMCHKTGFMGFIYKIARFFWKLFKTNPSCACGNAHY